MTDFFEENKKYIKEKFFLHISSPHMNYVASLQDFINPTILGKVLKPWVFKHVEENNIEAYVFFVFYIFLIIYIACL
jgi:hypothetical protein